MPKHGAVIELTVPNVQKLIEEIAILNKEKLHYFNKCQELEERKCYNCAADVETNGYCHSLDTTVHYDTFSCSLWEKRDD